jgi:hypothetical protein
MVWRALHPAFALLLLSASCTSARSERSPAADAGGPGGTSGTGGASPAGTGGATAVPGTGGGGSAGSDGSPGGGAESGGSPLTPDAPVARADGGSVDAPTDAAGCGASFCDDFEGFPAGAAPAGDWATHLENNGNLAVDETRAFSGSRSVHFNHQGSMASAMFLELRKPLMAAGGPVVHGRLMYWLNKNPTGMFSHFEIVRGTGPLAGGGTAQLNTGAENGKAFINYEPGDCSAPAPDVPFPEAKWTCYQFAFDGSKNQITEWVDGKMAVGPTTPRGTCWKWPTTVDTLHIGWESYHTPVLIDLWIDDVAVSDRPIPCPTGAPSKP